MRSSLKYQHPGIQFAVLLGLMAVMFIVATFLNSAMFPDVGKALASSGDEISREALSQFKWSQLISAILIFIVPALLYGNLSDEKPLRYLGMQKELNVIVLFAVMILVVVAQPFAIYLGQLNQQVHFGAIHDELKKMETFYEKAMTNFVRMNSSTDLLINLFIVAFLPALGEELFFRGALQNVLERWTRVPWIAIILSSLFFSLLHLTVFKFLGILTLGLILGIIFYLTRNLWYCILFHFLNNALALLASYYASRSETLKKISQDDFKLSVGAAIISLIITIGIFYLIRRRLPHRPLHRSLPPNSSINNPAI